MLLYSLLNKFADEVRGNKYHIESPISLFKKSTTSFFFLTNI